MIYPVPVTLVARPRWRRDSPVEVGEGHDLVADAVVRAGTGIGARGGSGAGPAGSSGPSAGSGGRSSSSSCGAGAGSSSGEARRRRILRRGIGGLLRRLVVDGIRRVVDIGDGRILSRRLRRCNLRLRLRTLHRDEISFRSPAVGAPSVHCRASGSPASNRDALREANRSFDAPRRSSLGRDYPRSTRAMIWAREGAISADDPKASQPSSFQARAVVKGCSVPSPPQLTPHAPRAAPPARPCLPRKSDAPLPPALSSSPPSPLSSSDALPAPPFPWSPQPSGPGVFDAVCSTTGASSRFALAHGVRESVFATGTRAAG